jgi:hypothetical protein
MQPQLPNLARAGSRVDGGENFLRLAALVGCGHVSGPLVWQVRGSRQRLPHFTLRCDS